MCIRDRFPTLDVSFHTNGTWFDTDNCAGYDGCVHSCTVRHGCDTKWQRGGESSRAGSTTLELGGSLLNEGRSPFEEVFRTEEGRLRLPLVGERLFERHRSCLL